MRKRTFTLLTLLLVMVASGCKKNRQYNFPNVAFEEYIYLNNPTNAPLQHPGGWVYHTGGHGGLIVYRRTLQGISDDFGVYDRSCPVHYDEGCGKLEVTDDDLFAECPCENEKYLLIDGSPGEGAEIGLRTYPASLNNGVLYVRN